jgi:hypothetical protein
MFGPTAMTEALVPHVPRTSVSIPDGALVGSPEGCRTIAQPVWLSAVGKSRAASQIRIGCRNMTSPNRGKPPVASNHTGIPRSEDFSIILQERLSVRGLVFAAIRLKAIRVEPFAGLKRRIR